LLSDETLKRSDRIKQEFEYKEVIRRGRLVTGRFLKAYFLINAGLDLKVGFIAGKRVGNACRRNRAKRLLREAYRRLKGGLPRQGWRVVFVATAATPIASLAEVRNEMVWMLEKSNLMREAQ
jgi:ribonuclease P protein component